LFGIAHHTRYRKKGKIQEIMEEIVIGQICQILCKDYFSEHQGNKIYDTIFLIQKQFDRKKKKP